MKENIKTLAIIFSVVLNLVFVGSYVCHRSGLFPRTGGQTHHNRLLYEELNLNREQLERFGPVRDSFHAFVNEQGRKIKAKQLELVGLLAKKKPDRRAIDAKQEEIRALQRQMQAKVIDHLFAESGILTPEQRQKFFTLIKGRIEKNDAPRPRWMPRKQVIPSKENRP